MGAAVVLVIGCCTGLYMIGSEEQPQSSGVVQTPTTAAALVPEVVVTTAPAEPSAAVTSVVPAGPKTVTMPKMVGKNAAVADDQLRKLGFSNIQYGSQDQDDTVVLLLSNWTVTKQSEKAGAKVETDTLIVLTCTKEN